MVGVTTMVFADQLRSTGLLASWLRAMVRLTFLLSVSLNMIIFLNMIKLYTYTMGTLHEGVQCNKLLYLHPWAFSRVV